VLIVDGDAVSALILEHFFKDNGIHVDHAASGSEALAMYRRNRYKLVISDWMLREVDGIELCRQFREVAENYVYFILCSSKCDKADLQEAYEAGIDDFLSKPLEPELLIQRLTVARRILETETRLRAQGDEMEHKSHTLESVNQSLVHASRRFEELFNGVPVACFTLDQAGLVHEWNRQSEASFGVPTYTAFQQSVWSVLGPMSDGFWAPELIEEVFQGRSVEGIDWTLRHPSGEERNFVCNLFGLRDTKGDLVGAISANLDITERKRAERRIDEQMSTINQQKSQLLKANRRLAQLALTDGMTGLMNHRGFQEELGRAFERNQRLGMSTSLILIDVDHFKDFNDTFGHQAGDSLLQRFGHLLQRTTRKHEPAARYGGEEFAIILDGADGEHATQAAERFRKAIESKKWPNRQITASFGVATVNSLTHSREDLIGQADMALYASKNRGRNCVTHYHAIDHVQVAV